MSPFDILIAHFGTQSAIAAGLGVKPMTVWQWKNRHRIPLEHAVRAEAITNGALTKEQLRPDVFEPIAKPKRKKPEAA